ncbi:EamA family transporter [Luteimonas salinilitoris]|uniref:EamA family transporter n=1 Tax=Luteimonas salinilitoris TaxID=3237697 RepID=A0ABV4HSN7_9GAMM
MNDLLLLLAVFLLSLSQVLQKIGATRRLASTRRPAEWAAALLSPELLAAGICVLAGTAVWLWILYRMDVSRAFPFLSLSSVLVVVASRVILKEHIAVHRWAGVALIALGIALVART